MIYEPKVVKVENNFAANRSVTVDEVIFNRDCLNIFLSSDTWELQVHFDAIYGFRVLDESDLCEFWDQCNLTTGWCFEVLTGGWNSLEKTRDHFLTGKISEPREFLIIGQNECVSVLAFEQPEVIETTSSNKPM